MAEWAHHESVLVALGAPLHLMAAFLRHHLAPAAAALPARHEARAAAALTAAAVLGRARREVQATGGRSPVAEVRSRARAERRRGGARAGRSPVAARGRGGALQLRILEYWVG